MTPAKRNLPKTAFRKGRIPWNKGLTKETDKRLDFERPTSFKKGRPAPLSAFKKGSPGFTSKHSSGTREKMSKNWEGKRKKEENGNWKGDDAGYSAIHKWVASNLGTPDTCEFCGNNGLSGRKIHWANKDHEYKRNLKDWLRLCAGCHVAYDRGREDNL